jgi:N6-adenosine-specific RNA methylase IME4
MRRFGAILIDPPWSFQVYSSKGKGRSAEHHYPTLSIDSLRQLPLPNVMAEDCAVFMWATWPTLPDAMLLGAAWGLTYKTCAFLWSKLVPKRANQATFMPIEDDCNWHLGMGYWSRANTEPCLLFTRGNPKRKSASVRQLIVAPVREHSRKPDEQYARIQQLVDGPYLEVFARNYRAGWHCWGNEVISTVDMYPLLPSGLERDA